MARELPEKTYKTNKIGNYDVTFYKNNEVEIVLDNNNQLNEVLLKVLLSSYNNIKIHNITSVNQFNSLVSFISENDFNSNILINLLAGKEDNIINGLENNRYINLESIPDNVKLLAFKANNSQTEFSTWAHNLNSEDKHTLLRVLRDEDKIRFVEQEKVIVDFYNTMVVNYPFIFNMNDKDKFTFIFDYIKTNYPYAYEATNREGTAVCPYFEWSQDALETYRRGRGVCEGRANLLTLVTNNPYMKLNCVTVEGKVGNVAHAWNQYIKVDGTVTDYDLSYNYKDKSMVEMRQNRNRSYERIYPKVFTWLKKYCKKKVLKPLPKDE